MHAVHVSGLMHEQIGRRFAYLDGVTDMPFWVPQKKELMLAQLRAELKISDERHEELRQFISNGEERPWLR